MTRDESDAMAGETWSLPVAWVGFLVLIMAILAVAGVSLLVQTVAGHAGPPLWFLVIWFAFLGWNVYWWLFRVAYRVDLVGETLHWKAPLNSGELPVSDITSVGRFWGTVFTCVLRAPGHQSVVVFTQLRSFEPMLAALNRLNPAVPPHQ